jgi:hypothetical protein
MLPAWCSEAKREAVAPPRVLTHSWELLTSRSVGDGAAVVALGRVVGAPGQRFSLLIGRAPQVDWAPCGGGQLVAAPVAGGRPFRGPVLDGQGISLLAGPPLAKSASEMLLTWRASPHSAGGAPLNRPLWLLTVWCRLG